MSPFLMPPLVKWTLVAARRRHGRALGGASEVRRVNEELDAQKARARIRDRGAPADAAARSVDRRIPALDRMSEQKLLRAAA